MKWKSVKWFGGEWRLSLYIGEQNFHHILDYRYTKEYHYIRDVKQRLMRHAKREGALQ